MEYIFHIATVLCIYAILAVSLDLLVGHAGQLSLAHGAFYAIGAYATAILCTRYGWSSVLAATIGMGLSAIIGAALSLTVGRFSGDYFAIATFGFQVILIALLENWYSLTNGPMGIPGVPPPSLFGFEAASLSGMAGLASLTSATVYWMVWMIVNSPFGRVLRAIREDELLAQSLGKNVVLFKVLTFAVSGAFASVGGSLFAHFITFVDPTSFGLFESILILSMVIIGGPASPYGPLVGALILVTLPELLRFVGFPADTAAQLRQILYGGTLVMLMLIRPRGLLGRYEFSDHAKE